MKFTIKPKGMNQLKGALDDVWADIVAELEIEMQNVIETPGMFPEFPDSDIVDTGRLRDSQQVTVKEGRVKFVWNPRSPETGYAYAPALYAGFMAFGRKWIPGRRWPEKAIDRVDVPEKMRQGMQRRGIRAKIKLKKKVI